MTLHLHSPEKGLYNRPKATYQAGLVEIGPVVG